MKDPSDDEDQLPQSSQPNPFSFKNFQFSLKSDLLQADDLKIESKQEQENPLSFNTFFQDNQILELPDIDSNLLDQSDYIDELPAFAEPAPDELEFNDSKKGSFFSNERNVGDQKHDQSKLIAKQEKIIAKLEKRIKELECKEESEAKTLELLVQQVEKNLEIATTRATEAENKVEFLKQEAAEMKHQIKILKNENQTLKNVNNRNLFITIKKISTELNTAAFSAEKSLSFLSNGVETLKLIAANLESLEKISEAND